MTYFHSFLPVFNRPTLVRRYRKYKSLFCSPSFKTRKLDLAHLKTSTLRGRSQVRHHGCGRSFGHCSPPVGRWGTFHTFKYRLVSSECSRFFGIRRLDLLDRPATRLQARTPASTPVPSRQERVHWVSGELLIQGQGGLVAGETLPPPGGLWQRSQRHDERNKLLKINKNHRIF